MARRVHLITHPDVIIDPDVPVPQWPLSPRGRARMERMLSQPWAQGIGAVYCSTEQKAVDGAEILASHLGLHFETVGGLGEIDRSATGYLPHDEHRATADRLFAFPDESVRGWETARNAQQRVVRAVDAVLARASGPGDIAIITHGGVATFCLCHVKGIEIDGSQEPAYPGGGCYFCFEAGSWALVHGWKTIDD